MNYILARRIGRLFGSANVALLSGLLLSGACDPTAQDVAAFTDGDAGAEDNDLDEKATSVTYEAESGTSDYGCDVAKNHEGFSGSGFINFGGSGSWLEWTNVNVSAAGEYSLSIRYANGGSTERAADITVNGAKAGSLSFAATGGWTVWKTMSVKGMLRKGTNTIRITATTSNGGPNIDRMEVSGGSTPTGSGTVADLEFVNFASLPRSKQLHTFTNVNANYIVYDESNGREGHDDINKDQPGFVSMRGATLIGYGGGRDKYITLFKVTSSTVVIDIDQGQDDTDGGAGHALFIRTKRALSVAEARSVDPSVRSEDVPGPRASNEIVIYAEDEGGHGDRDSVFMPLSYRHYGSGDDLVYVFAKSLGDTPNGNGAFMRLKIQ